jgi:predicted Zn-dependent protease
MRRLVLLVLTLALLLPFSAAVAQEPGSLPEQVEKKPMPLSPAARLAAAKTVYLKNAERSSDLPFNVIQGAIESWAKYTIVDSPDKADIVVEVKAPFVSGLSMYNDPEEAKKAGHKDTDEGRQLEINEIALRVYDARSKLVLFAGADQMRGFAARQKTKTDKIVAAAQRLFTRFHDLVEPPPPAK